MPKKKGPTTKGVFVTHVQKEKIGSYKENTQAL